MDRKVDWRKKRLVYVGIEHLSLQGINPDHLDPHALGTIERADADLSLFRQRTLGPDAFYHYYGVGLEAEENARYEADIA